MGEVMTPYKRVEAAWNLQEADRVPVAPMVIYLLPYRAGLSVKEAIENPERLAQAAIDQSELVGDFIHPALTLLDHQAVLPNSTWDRVSIDWRIWEHFPPQGNIPSSYFDKDLIGDYADILERGFASRLFSKRLNKEIFQRSVDEWLYSGFDYPRDFWRAWHRFVRETGKMLQMGARALIPFDALISYRTFEGMVEDVIDRPELVKEACRLLGEYEIVGAMRRCMVAGAGEIPGADRIFLGNGLGAPPYVSPAIFDEFVYPYLKMQVDMAVTRGFKVHVHLDGDLTAALETLSHIADGLPRGHVMLDFEKTNMRKAKEVLGDKVCIYGNVPAVLMVYGTAKEVDDYCRKLIQDCAKGGGFILGSECEVPWDARPENVRAMIAAADHYGRY